MATNIYLPRDAASAQRLERGGFRWCTKDCRWESKRNLSSADAEDLAAELNAKIEVTGGHEPQIVHPKGMGGPDVR